MARPKKDAIMHLIPGKVSDTLLERLIKMHTDIRSKPLISAIREHLVNGVSQAEACRMHKMSPSTLSVSLQNVQRASVEVLALMKEPFYIEAMTKIIAESQQA